MKITTTALGIGMAGLLLLAACGDDTTTTAGTTSTTAAPGSSTTSTTVSGNGDGGSTTTTATDGGIDPLEGAGTDPVSSDPADAGYGQLTDIEIGRHEGYDRVVFTFSGDSLPGYVVEYTTPPITEDASGNELDIDGSAFLRVRMEPASGFDMNTGQPSYNGPSEIRGTAAGTSEIVELQRAGDFEAVLTWVIGLADKVDFLVDTLSSPARLVIDVRNH